MVPGVPAREAGAGAGRWTVAQAARLAAAAVTKPILARPLHAPALASIAPASPVSQAILDPTVLDEVKPGRWRRAPLPC